MWAARFYTIIYKSTYDINRSDTTFSCQLFWISAEQQAKKFQLRKRTLLLIKDCYHHRCRHIRDTRGFWSQCLSPSATSGSSFDRTVWFILCHFKSIEQFVFTTHFKLILTFLLNCFMYKELTAICYLGDTLKIDVSKYKTDDPNFSFKNVSREYLTKHSS